MCTFLYISSCLTAPNPIWTDMRMQRCSWWRKEDRRNEKKKIPWWDCNALLTTLQGACVRDCHYTIIRNPRNVTASAHLWMHVCTAQGESEGGGMHRLREHDQHPPNQNVFPVKKLWKDNCTVMRAWKQSSELKIQTTKSAEGLQL